MRQAITFLHLSDFHFGGENSNSVLKASKNFLFALQSGNLLDLSRKIDFIVVTGDFTNEGNKQGFVHASHFLSALSGILSVEKTNVIISPGNHDLEFTSPEKWASFIDFYKTFYGKEGSAKFDEIHNAEVALGEPIRFVDVRVSKDPPGILSVVFNSAASMEKEDDQGTIGKAQLDLIANFVKQAEDSNSIVSKIAVLHHHILPVLSESLPAEDRLYKYNRDVILDSSKMIHFLMENGFPIVFHGHFHKDFFSAITSPALPSDGTGDVPSMRDLVVVGSGSVTCNARSLHPQHQYYHFQLITLYLHPSEYYEPRVVVEPFYYKDEGWKRGSILKYPYSISVLHEKIFQKEKFFGDRDFLGGDIWGLNPQEWFWDILSKTIDGVAFGLEQRDERLSLTEKQVEKHTLSPFKKEEKEKILERLVQNIKVYNRSRNFVFTATPVQLDGIYTFASMFFTPEELNEYASIEFPKDQWKDFIDLIQSRRENPLNWSHLDWANRVIAERAAFHLKDRLEDDNTKEIFILESGFGGLKTILELLWQLWSYSERIQKRDCLIRYRGIDIAHELVDHAKKVIDIAKSASSLDNSESPQELEIRKDLYQIFNRLEPYDAATPLLHRGNLYDTVMDTNFVTKYKNQIDIFIASYMMHHVYNSKRLVHSIQRGTFQRILDIACDGNVHKYANNMCPQILGKGCSSNQFIENVGAIRKGMKTEWFRMNVRNLQKEIYCRVHDLLKPGGLICIADPNGFSKTFNRRIIFDQPNIAIANFSDIPDCLDDLFEAGFRNFEAWRQVRLGDDTIVNLPYLESSHRVESTKEIFEEDFDLLKYNKDGQWPAIMEKIGHLRGVSHPLEIEDQHLGYIIIGKKMRHT